MTTLYLLILTLLSLLLLPIIASSLSKENDEEILVVKQDNTKNPRYFSESFKAKFLEALEDYKGDGSVKLSKDEDLVVLQNSITMLKKFDGITFAKSDMTFKNNATFDKEIYAKKNVTIGDKSVVRAIAGEQLVTLGDYSQVLRWLDGEKKVKTGQQCDLGISTTSGNSMVIGSNNTFRRLYAPYIYFGDHEKENNHVIDLPVEVNPEIVKNIRKLANNQDNTFENTIVSKHDLTISNGMEVKGSITTHGTLVIEKDCIVHGNVFAEDNIFIGANVKIYGTVFTQEDIDIAQSVQIGLPGKIKSLIARGNIFIGQDTVVYGYVSCEQIGKTR